MSSEITHYAYFTRTGRYNKTFRLSNEHNFMYELKSVARTTTSGMDVYLNYFHSPYNQYYHRLSSEQGELDFIKVDDTHISEFFSVFLQLYLLRTCIALNERISNSTVSALIDLFGSDPAKHYHFLRLFLKNKRVFRENYLRNSLIFKAEIHILALTS
jgi:hypothetical protein